jgi:hypothetical protein
MPEHHYAPAGIQDGHQLVNDAREAGIDVPPDPFYFDPMEYPRFWLLCVVQMGRPFRHAEPRHNATVVASVTDDEIYTITLEDLMNRGLWFASYASSLTESGRAEPLLFQTMGRSDEDKKGGKS